jgi:hypothetical protein
MPIRAIARLIQTMLYSRRFFPYYVYNILGGIEDDGERLLPVRPSFLTYRRPSQELAQFTHLTPSARTSARHVVPRELHKPLCNHS